MPLSKFLKSDRMLKALRKGVAAMKQRKPYDPFSWFYQAAIHGVPPEMVKAAREKLDTAGQDAFDAVFQKRYWNQCPHNGEESANFLPWHRGYTYYFEKILRMHTEDKEFSLPYWDYEDKSNRTFPKAFGEKYVDGDPKQPNPLFLAQRDTYFTGYDHPFAVGLPLLELTDDAVDSSSALATPFFFGETETQGLGGGYADEDPTTRGLLESRPHDHIHRAVGGVIPLPEGVTLADGSDTVTGAMAQPPTAGFDPIFCVHHSNIDRLWAVWSCMPGKSWGKCPPAYWFSERPWFFWDVDEQGRPQVVNEPRQNYFSHRALGIEFEDKATKCDKPLELPDIDKLSTKVIAHRIKLEIVAQERIEFAVLPLGRTVVPLRDQTKTRLIAPFKAHRDMRATNATPEKGQHLMMRLANLDLGLVPATGFDIHVTAKPNNAALRRSDKSYVGSVALFRHQLTGAAGASKTNRPENHGDNGMPAAHGGGDTFDISEAVSALGDVDLNELKIVVVPYALLTIPGKETVHVSTARLRVGGVQFLLSK